MFLPFKQNVLHPFLNDRDFPSKAAAMEIGISTRQLQWRIGKEVPRTCEYIEISSMIVAVMSWQSAPSLQPSRRYFKVFIFRCNLHGGISTV